LFSHLVQASRHGSGGVGWAMGINTLGGSGASLIFGVLLLPMVGSKWTLVGLILAYLLLCPVSGWRSWVSAIPAVLLAIIIGYGPGAQALLRLDAKVKLIEFCEGPMATVIVEGDDHGNYWLKINSFHQGGTRSRFPDFRQGTLPLLLHPDPRQALYLGLGAGMTFQAAGDFPGLRADGVELVPELLSVLHHFEQYPGQLFNRPNLSIHTADARRYVRATTKKYDVIVGDLFHPGRDGAGSLYTVEHFSAIRERLSEKGLFCQWLPLYQLDLDMLRVITKSFLKVFPDATLWLCHNSADTPIIGLIGHQSAGDWPPAGKFADQPDFVARLQQLNLAGEYSILGNYLAGPDELTAWSASSLLNTDDRPVVTFNAPRFTYWPIQPARDRLLTLLDEFHPRSDRFYHSTGREQQATRLEQYWIARDSFLRGMAAQSPGERLNLIRSSLHQSRDFSDAYFFLFSRVVPDLAREDQRSAQALLEELAQAHPDRPQAPGLLHRLMAR
jgi:spermidine synthase